MSQKQGVSVAVVGHTNAGKTSLMRTLLRDSHFGNVANTAGTTRHVGWCTFVTGATGIAPV